MEIGELVFIITLTVMNLAIGFGFAIPLARLFGKSINGMDRFFRHFAFFVLIYFLECVAFPAGMATQVFSVGLAFVWGIAFGIWLRKRSPRSAAVRFSFYLSLYSCLPTASFAILLSITWLLIGKSIISVQEGFNLGIPGFVPWPFNTILGFCSALILGTIILKTSITIGLVGLVFKTSQFSEPSARIR
jgi:hypothetical protein